MTFSTALNGQELKCFKIDEYAAFVGKIQKGYDAMDSLQQYKMVLLSMEATLKARIKEVESQENLLTLERERFTICQQQKSAAIGIINSKDVIIKAQADNIKRLGSTVKYWNVSLSAGYGYSLSSTITRAPFIGISIGRTIFKF